MKTIIETSSEAVFLKEICEQFHLEDGERYHVVENSLSLSAHAEGIVKACNEMITEFPESRNTIFALLTYSTQKWASEARRKIQLNEMSDSVMRKDEMLLFRQYKGILKQDISPRLDYDYKWKLESSEKIILCIEDAVKWLEDTPVYGENLAKVIKAAHFAEDHSDISLFLFKRYYRMAVTEICHQFGSQIDALVAEMAQPDLLYGESIYGRSYHNTAQLVKIYPFAGRRLLNHGSPEDIWSDIRLQRDSNGLYLLLVYTRAVNLLTSYPDRGEEMYRIISYLHQGLKLREISEKMQMSQNYIRTLRNKAINLLSFILWGYSTSRILNNLVLNQS